MLENKLRENTICFTNAEDIELLNKRVQNKFVLEEYKIEDKDIEKMQFDNLKFGIYFLKSKSNKEEIFAIKNKKEIKCGNYFIEGNQKEFYTDLYFYILHPDGKDRNIIFEELIEKILKIIKIKKLGHNIMNIIL